MTLSTGAPLMSWSTSTCKEFARMLKQNGQGSILGFLINMKPRTSIIRKSSKLFFAQTMAQQWSELEGDFSRSQQLLLGLTFSRTSIPLQAKVVQAKNNIKLVKNTGIEGLNTIVCKLFHSI